MSWNDLHYLEEDEYRQQHTIGARGRAGREATDMEKAAALAAEEAKKAEATAAWEAKVAAKEAEEAKKAEATAAKAMEFFTGLVGKKLQLDGVVAPIKRNGEGAIVALVEATWNGKPLGRNTVVVLFDPALGRTPNHGYSRGTDAEKFQSWAAKQSKKL